MNELECITKIVKVRRRKIHKFLFLPTSDPSKELTGISCRQGVNFIPELVI
jgi:hypothetical protein